MFILCAEISIRFPGRIPLDILYYVNGTVYLYTYEYNG